MPKQVLGSFGQISAQNLFWAGRFKLAQNYGLNHPCPKLANPDPATALMAHWTGNGPQGQEVLYAGSKGHELESCLELKFRVQSPSVEVGWDRKISGYPELNPCVLFSSGEKCILFYRAQLYSYLRERQSLVGTGHHGVGICKRGWKIDRIIQALYSIFHYFGFLLWIPKIIDTNVPLMAWNTSRKGGRVKPWEHVGSRSKGLGFNSHF